MHVCLFKPFIYFILLCFLNMCFAPTLEAMHRGGADVMDAERAAAVRALPRGAASLSSPKEADVFALDTAQVQRVAHALGQVRFPVDTDFWVSLSGFNEALRRGEELSPHAKRAIIALSGIGAVLAGGAITELFIFDGAPANLFRIVPPNTNIPPIPPALAGAGAVAGVLVIADAYWTFKNALHEYSRRSSQYDPLAREEDRGKSMGFVFVAGGMLVYAGKELFAYAIANFNPPGYLLPIIILAGVPYFLLKAKGAYDVFQAGWDYIYRGAKHRILKKMGHRIAGEEAKDDLRTAFGKSFRKNLHNPHAAIDLFLSIQAVQTFVEERTKEFNEVLKGLKERHAGKGTDKLARHELDLQIIKTEEDLLNMQRLGELLVFKLLHDFGEDKPSTSKAAHSSEGKDPDAPPRKYHPAWDYVAKATGVVVGGMASGSVWYGFKFILNTFGASDGVANTLASLIAPPIVAFLAKKWGDSFSRIFRFAADYNPIEAEKHISETAVSYPRFRAMMAFLNLCRSTYVNLPTALVGAEGLGAALIPPAQGFATNIPAMMGYGAALNEETRARLDEMISAAHMKFGTENWQENIKQWLASELGRASEWVEHLKGRNAIILREYMHQEPEEWFASFFAAQMRAGSPVSGDGRVTDVTDVMHGDHSARGGHGVDGSGEADASTVRAAATLSDDAASVAAVLLPDADIAPAPDHDDRSTLLRKADVRDDDESSRASDRASAGSQEDLQAATGVSAKKDTLPSSGPRRWALQAWRYLKGRTEALAHQVAVRISPFGRDTDVPLRDMPPQTRKRQETARMDASVVGELQRPLLADQ